MLDNLKSILQTAAEWGAIVAVIIPQEKPSEEPLNFKYGNPFAALNPNEFGLHDEDFKDEEEDEVSTPVAAPENIKLVKDLTKSVRMKKLRQFRRRSKAQKAAWVRRKAAVVEATSPKRKAGRPKKSA